MGLNCHRQESGGPREREVFLYSVIPQKLIKEQSSETPAGALASDCLGSGPDSAFH